MCGIRIPWQLTGYTTYLVKEPAPLHVQAMTRCEVHTITFEEMDIFLMKKPELKDKFITYCCRSFRSDLDAILAVSTMSAEKCFWIFFASFFMTLKADFTQPWHTLPFKISRSSVAGLLYVSLLTVDRLYAGFIKRGLLKKENGFYCFHSDGLKEGVNWIMQRYLSPV